jgi:hypothetical protein
VVGHGPPSGTADACTVRQMRTSADAVLGRPQPRAEWCSQRGGCPRGTMLLRAVQQRQELRGGRGKRPGVDRGRLRPVRPVKELLKQKACAHDSGFMKSAWMAELLL